MDKPRFDWSRTVFRDIRTSPEPRAAVANLTESVAHQAGDGYETRPVEVSGGRGRARGIVITATPKAAVHESKHHTLAGLASGQHH